MRPSTALRALRPALNHPLTRVTATPLAARAIPLALASAPARGFTSTPAAWKKGGKAAGGKGGADKKGKKAAEEESGLLPGEIDEIVARAQKRMDKALEWARTTVYDGVERGRGRVMPAILDSVKVQMPEQGMVPLKAVASVTVKGNTLIVEVWDGEAIKHIESAIHKANIPGISPQREGNTLRIPVSRPTADVRREILKSLHDATESAKGQVRIARTDAFKALGGRGEEGSDDVQKATDKVTTELEQMQQTAKKELEK